MGARYTRPVDRKVFSHDAGELEERVVSLSRVAKVVKGGRRFSFSALVVVGNKSGVIGYGLGKANEVPDAIRKASEGAKKRLVSVPRNSDTIPYQIFGYSGAARVLLKPASPGTGVIAGGVVRSVMELLGVKDILTKSFGSRNPHNVLGAVFEALAKLESTDEVLSRRGIVLEDVDYRAYGV